MLRSFAAVGWAAARTRSSLPLRMTQPRFVILRYAPHPRITTIRFYLRSSKLEQPQVQKSEETQKVAIEAPSTLASQVYNLPNMITMSRIASIPFIGYFLAAGHSTTAATVFTYACVTDFVDGYIARKYNMKTVLGSVLDPAADKFLMTTCTIALSIQGSMPLYVAGMILGRDVMLSVMGMFIRFQALPPPRNFKRFVDLSIPTHSVHPNLLGKANTALQMFYIGGLVLQPWLETLTPLASHELFDWFGAMVCATTFVSGMSYVLQMNSFKAIK